MKLLVKTTRYYLVYTLFVFTIGSLFFYFSIKQVIYDGIDEALHQEKIILIDNLKYENNVDSLKFNEATVIKKLGLSYHQVYDHFYTLNTHHDSTTTVKYRQLESVFVHDNVYYLLKIKQSLAKEDELIQSIVPIGIVMFMILLVGILGISNFISVRVWAPFYSIIDQLRNYDIKKGNIVEYQKKSIIEFDTLSNDLFVITSKINEDYKTQKEFNENFSHELQTPLAIIQNSIENMIQSPNLKEEEMNQVSSVLEATKRISSLSKGLLLLTQISSNQFIDVSTIDIVEVSKKMIQYFSGILEVRKITVHEKYKDNLFVKANQVLIDILMTNLISNAIRHNIPEGDIAIEVGDNKIIISNSGKPLEGNVNTIFDRFVKLGEKKNSIGLGLPIVKKICEVSGFTIFYENVGARHTVTIHF